MALEWLNSVFNAKAIENFLSSLTTPLLSALQVGFNSARANPNIAFVGMVVVTGGSYLVYRKFRKRSRSEDLSDIRTAYERTNGMLIAQGTTLSRQETLLGDLARNLLTLNATLLNIQTAANKQDSNQAELLQKFRLQEGSFIVVGDHLKKLDKIQQDTTAILAQRRTPS